MSATTAREFISDLVSKKIGKDTLDRLHLGFLSTQHPSLSDSDVMVLARTLRAGLHDRYPLMFA